MGDSGNKVRVVPTIAWAPAVSRLRALFCFDVMDGPGQWLLNCELVGRVGFRLYFASVPMYLCRHPQPLLSRASTALTSRPSGDLRHLMRQRAYQNWQPDEQNKRKPLSPMVSVSMLRGCVRVSLSVWVCVDVWECVDNSLNSKHPAPPCPTNTVSNEHYPFGPYFWGA